MRFKGKAGISIVVVKDIKVWCIHIQDPVENHTSIQHSVEESCQYMHGIPVVATHDITRALKDYYGDHQLTATY
jgi:hypothetical protein